MKNSIKNCVIAVTVLSGIGDVALSGQPPDVVVSDSQGNTAMGSHALSMNTTGGDNTAAGFQTLVFNDSGTYNTATGVNALYYNTSGYANTATGYGALSQNKIGNNNAADGFDALAANSTGSFNAAFGSDSLASNTTGSYNTAAGWHAMFYNTTDSENTAFGAKALSGSASGPTTGSANTAIGFQALYQNAGNNNTAVGTDAMEHNTSGYDNTAVGAAALYSGGGVANTALGYGALTSDIDGRNNTASGFRTLFFNTEGNNNIATGYSALYSNVTGSNNIAIGNMAGYAITNTSDNIDIGNQGVAGDSGIIRIGASPTQTTVYIAGINTTMVTGSAVYVTSKGQLGVLASSERYKTEIVSMGSNTERLQRLRPVSFHLKTDPKRELQYGLIAEEVDKVYPELVIRDEAGKIQGVRYDELAPMLLNEMQRQQQKLDAQAEQLYNVQQQLAELKQLNQSMQAALSKLQAPDEHVAMR